jgi:hypothetical protein
VIKRRQDRDLRFMLPLLADLTEDQAQLLFMFQARVLRHAAGALLPVTDQDVGDAAAAAAATLETAGKGIIYQHQASSIPAQRLADDLLQGFEELASTVGSQRGRLERAAAVALRQLAVAASTASKAMPEDEPPVLLRILGRIMSEAAEGEERSEGAAVADPASRLIIPG